MQTSDPYYSRTEPHWEIADRCDPVCWGKDEGPLNEKQIASFERDGFVVLEQLLSTSEVADYLKEAHRLSAETDPTREDVVTEPSGDAIRSVFRVHRESSIFARLVHDPRLIDTARQVLASDVYVHQSRINFKPGFTGRSFFWHSDFETWHIEDGMPRPRALSASILLTDNSTLNAPLMLVPGSHKNYVRCVGKTPDNHYKTSLRTQQFGVPTAEALHVLCEKRGITQATGPAGTVVLFDSNTMHSSTENLSPYPRHNVFLVFNSTDNRLQAPYGGTQPRPDFLAERSANEDLARGVG